MLPAIRIEDLGKRYAIRHEARSRARYQYRTLQDSLWKGLKSIIRGREKTEDFWALRHLNVEIQPGQRVGIIGHNGAGKSTLLKLLSRVTFPSEGRVSMRGRVASLLEVGTGFHPELTGLENIYLNGSVLGMDRHEVRSKLDAIVAFAEVERFLDTPVKRYSSGMYMRLAFSVAAHLEPDILIVDEVLTVGDAAFQKKCLARLGEVSNSGRTVLFVSHQMEAVQRLCDRCLVLEAGAVTVDTDDVRAAVEHYLHPNIETSLTEWSGSSGGHSCFMPRRLTVTLENGQPVKGSVPVSSALMVLVEAEVTETDSALVFGIDVYDASGFVVFRSYFNDGPEKDWPKIGLGKIKVGCRLPGNWLNEGLYRIELTAGLHSSEWILEPGKTKVAIQLELRGGLSDSPFWYARRHGSLAPILEWRAM